MITSLAGAPDGSMELRFSSALFLGGLFPPAKCSTENTSESAEIDSAEMTPLIAMETKVPLWQLKLVKGLQKMVKQTKCSRHASPNMKCFEVPAVVLKTVKLSNWRYRCS